jgi:hypothetical protein
MAINHYRTLKRWFLLAGVLALSPSAFAAEFKERELFRIPFGAARGELGARVENDQFVYPRSFTIDGAGRFYIYDSLKHRIARFSSSGTFEIGFNYPETAQRIFAHADSQDNLWLLISDPVRGLYYGVYDASGKRLREGIFSQFNDFQLHLDDDYTLHAIFSSTKNPSISQTYLFDETRLLMKKENVAKPPENHHQVRQNERRYFIDAVPGAQGDNAKTVNRVTDESRKKVGQIQGTVIYITERGDVYTRVGDCEVRVYGLEGSLKGTVSLPGLKSACSSIGFDSDGNIYQLDGIPDATAQYTPKMTGMRLLLWERR